MRPIVDSIASEYQRYKALGEGAMQQLAEAELNLVASSAGNSVAVIVWHIAGNLESRFTDFLTSDGEKPWRHRDDEFSARTATRQDLMKKWEQGWTVLNEALAELTDQHLSQLVTIRGRALAVHEALHRSLAHTSYHVGQIVYAAKMVKGREWRYLSIAPGDSVAYNQDPTLERPGDHSAALDDQTKQT